MIKLLVLADDCWHPAETLMRAFKGLDNTKYLFDFVCAPRDILSKRMIRDYDAVILARGNTFSSALNKNVWFDPDWCEVMPDDFGDYVAEGHGFISLHAGNCYKLDDCPDMVRLIGNEFKYHPKQCDVTVTATKEHPITKGVQPFTARDEHYVIDVISEDADVFLKSTSDFAPEQAAGYTRLIGKGRLCVLTPGHTLSAMGNNEYLRLISNAIDWCTAKA